MPHWPMTVALLSGLTLPMAEGNSIALVPGATGHLAWTFTHVGRCEFACLIPGHFEAGMHGTIVVER